MEMSEGILTSIEMLKGRTLKTFKIAHVLLWEGTYVNLDFYIISNTLEELIMEIQAKIEGLFENDILPSAPLNLWEKFIANPVILPLVHFESDSPYLRKPRILLVIRGAA